MSNWTWDSITERYETAAAGRPDQQTSQLARGMLDILPDLRDRIPSHRLHLYMHMLTLQITYEGILQSISIVWFQRDTYLIYLEENGAISDETHASTADAVDTVLRYIDHIHGNA